MGAARRFEAAGRPLFRTLCPAVPAVPALRLPRPSGYFSSAGGVRCGSTFWVRTSWPQTT